jgi:hypothetical protein
LRNGGTLVQELCRLSPLAHHPDCPCFDDHLIRVGRLALCLGCTSLSIGLCLGSAIIYLAVVFHPIATVRAGCFGHVLVGLACFVPTLVQPYWQKRWFKITARCALGVAIVFLWFGSIALLPETLFGMVLRGVFLSVFFAVATGTMAIRKRHMRQVWRGCKSGGFPFCKENLSRKAFLFDEDRCRLEDGNGVLVTLLAKVTRDSVGTTDIEFITADKVVSRSR